MDGKLFHTVINNVIVNDIVIPDGSGFKGVIDNSIYRDLKHYSIYSGRVNVFKIILNYSLLIQSLDGVNKEKLFYLLTGHKDYSEQNLNTALKTIAIKDNFSYYSVTKEDICDILNITNVEQLQQFTKDVIPFYINYFKFKIDNETKKTEFVEEAKLENDIIYEILDHQIKTMFDGCDTIEKSFNCWPSILSPAPSPYGAKH